MRKRPKHAQTMAPRNPFVAAARFKKAGAHRKSNKALRRTETTGLVAQLAEHSAFNRDVSSSTLDRPTTRVFLKARLSKAFARLVQLDRTGSFYVPCRACNGLHSRWTAEATKSVR